MNDAAPNTIPVNIDKIRRMLTEAGEAGDGCARTMLALLEDAAPDTKIGMTLWELDRFLCLVRPPSARLTAAAPRPEPNPWENLGRSSRMLADVFGSMAERFEQGDDVAKHRAKDVAELAELEMILRDTCKDAHTPAVDLLQDLIVRLVRLAGCVMARRHDSAAAELDRMPVGLHERIHAFADADR